MPGCFGVGDQHHVEPSGAHRQVLDTGDCGELSAERSPIVLLDVDEDEGRDSEAERERIDGRREAGMTLSSRRRWSLVWAVHLDTLMRSARSVSEIRASRNTAEIRARSTLSICRSEAASSGRRFDILFHN